MICAFQKKPDVERIPGILIALNEEEGVSEKIQFKNCFRHLRNIAAHEPETLVQGFFSKYNIGCQKIVFHVTGDSVVVLDMVQLTVWMFDMYLQTSEIEYILYVQGMFRLLYAPVLGRYAPLGRYSFVEEGDARLIAPYVDWLTWMYQKCGMVRTFGVDDPYVSKLLKENPKVFWRMAIPSLMDLASFYLAGCVDLEKKSDIQYFKNLYVAREGNQSERG